LAGWASRSKSRFAGVFDLDRRDGDRRHATNFKAAWRKAVSGGTSDMALLSSKKRETRKSLSQPGWITLEGGFAARQCVVQDLSTTGAKVTIDDPNSLPAKLRLAFSRDARTGRRCEVVWRRGKSVGVKFVR
jgi:PilZ domain